MKAKLKGGFEFDESFLGLVNNAKTTDLRWEMRKLPVPPGFEMEQEWSCHPVAIFSKRLPKEPIVGYRVIQRVDEPTLYCVDSVVNAAAVGKFAFTMREVESIPIASEELAKETVLFELKRVSRCEA